MILTAEQLARLPACAAIVAAKGIDAPYLADCAVRAYQGRHVAELCRDLDLACGAATELVIEAGIGRLTLAWTGNRCEPAGRGTIAPRSIWAEPLTAPPDLRDQRQALCSACRHHVGQRCTVAGCSCAGLGQPARRFSRCPIGAW